MKNFFLLAITILLSSCVSAPVLEKTMESYRGLEEKVILQVFGQPNKTYVDEEGFRVLSFGERGVLKHPDCVANFLINSDNRVQRWNWNGRHCQEFTQKTDAFSESHLIPSPN